MLKIRTVRLLDISCCLSHLVCQLTLINYLFLFWLIILLLKYNITNIWYDCGQYTRTFSLGTLNCMDVLYYPPPLASGNITHSCNSRYFGKIFLYIDHNHMEYLYNITRHQSQFTYLHVSIFVSIFFSPGT